MTNPKEIVGALRERAKSMETAMGNTLSERDRYKAEADLFNGAADTIEQQQAELARLQAEGQGAGIGGEDAERLEPAREAGTPDQLDLPATAEAVVAVADRLAMAAGWKDIAEADASEDEKWGTVGATFRREARELLSLALPHLRTEQGEERLREALAGIAQAGEEILPIFSRSRLVGGKITALRESLKRARAALSDTEEKCDG